LKAEKWGKTLNIARNDIILTKSSQQTCIACKNENFMIKRPVSFPASDHIFKAKFPHRAKVTSQVAHKGADLLLALSIGPSSLESYGLFDKGLIIGVSKKCIL
jgi:hypothetical protein